MKRMICLLLSVVLLLGLTVANAAPVSAESEFSISDECVELLKAMEGFDRYPRWDYSQWTVGHGSRCPDEDLERYRANGITYEEADALLRTHAATFAKSVNSFIDKYDLQFNQNQFDAVLLFTYNFGPSWMFREGSWRTGLINGVTGNDFMFEIGQWCHAGGSILTPLIVRRLIEANIYFNGVYSRSIPDNYCYVIFELNGGEAETDVQAYDSNLPAEIRVIPTRAGYTFAGWYTAQQGGKKITSLDQSTRNLTLYARWVAGENTEIPDEPVEDTPAVPEKMDPVTVEVRGIDVNVRIGPGTNYTAVDKVSTGYSLTVTEIQTGTGYTWGKFGDDRWIALMYTTYDQVINQQPEEPETEPTVPPTEPTVPETEPTVPPTEPTVPETEPTVPPTEPTVPETEPTVPPTEPTVPETEPTVPPTEPTVPETEPTVPPTEPPVVEKPEEAGVKGTVTGSDLRIRSGAGTGYEILGWLQIGDRVTITERKMVGSMEWGKMEQGWISLTYVKLDAPAQEPEQTPSQPAVPPTEPETQPTEPEQTNPVTQTGYVNVNEFLRIRSGAGLGYAVAGYYGPNDRVTILQTRTVEGMTWGRTDRGWISMDYVILDGAEEAPPTQDPSVITGYVNVNDFLRIRGGAGLDNTIVGYLSYGERVTITETRRADGMTWGKIPSGWISMDYVIVD